MKTLLIEHIKNSNEITKHAFPTIALIYVSDAALFTDEVVSKLLLSGVTCFMFLGALAPLLEEQADWVICLDDNTFKSDQTIITTQHCKETISEIIEQLSNIFAKKHLDHRILFLYDDFKKIQPFICKYSDNID